MPTIRDLKKRQARIGAGVRLAMERHARWCEEHPDHPNAQVFLKAEAELRQSGGNLAAAAEALSTIHRLLNEQPGR